jgi:DNA polymerase/3'-5' exonuclease PolX
MEICKRAQVLGYRWNPYGGGFVNLYNGELRRCHTEDEVFAFVGLPWLPPEERR